MLDKVSEKRLADASWLTWPDGMYTIPKLRNARSGEWAISRVEVSKHHAIMANMRSLRDDGGLFAVRPGKYIRLTSETHGIVMSNTPMELATNQRAVSAAFGRVLISGLGLGIVAHSIAHKEDVESVTVIELEPDVIKLVSKSLHPKVTVVQGDALSYVPKRGERYDVIYHDIWLDISRRNLPSMRKLMAKWSRRCVWQECWMRREMQSGLLRRVIS